jgi:hypothetical protein
MRNCGARQLERYGDAGLKEQHDAAVARGEKDPVTKTVI